jgi:hypothetical protein
MLTMIEPVQYSDVLHVRVEQRLREAIQTSAAKYGVKPAEFVRNALWTVLALQGNDDNPDVRADGTRRYAHLMNGVVDVRYLEPTP